MNQVLENSYRFTVCYGDGLPKEAIVKAKTGTAAYNLALKSFPGARAVHLKGLLYSNERPSKQAITLSHQKPQVFLGGMKSKLKPVEPPDIREQKKAKALALAAESKSSGQIAKLIDIPPSTVRRWINDASKNACNS